MSLPACTQTLHSVCLSGNKAEITNLVTVFVFLCVFVFYQRVLNLELHLVCGDFMLDFAQSCMVVWNPQSAGGFALSCIFITVRWKRMKLNIHFQPAKFI